MSAPPSRASASQSRQSSRPRKTGREIACPPFVTATVSNPAASAYCSARCPSLRPQPPQYAHQASDQPSVFHSIPYSPHKRWEPLAHKRAHLGAIPLRQRKPIGIPRAHRGDRSRFQSQIAELNLSSLARDTSTTTHLGQATPTLSPTFRFQTPAQVRQFRRPAHVPEPRKFLR